MEHFQSQFQLRSDYEIRQGIKKYGKFNFFKKCPYYPKLIFEDR